MSKWQRPAACTSGACPEVWVDGAVVHLRSTERPEKVVTYSGQEWADLKAAIQAGEYD